MWCSAQPWMERNYTKIQYNDDDETGDEEEGGRRMRRLIIFEDTTRKCKFEVIKLLSSSLNCTQCRRC